MTNESDWYRDHSLLLSRLKQPSGPVNGPQSADTASPKPEQQRLPKKVGRFHVERVIASGGMGTVYEAIQEHPRRSVAIKVMKQGVASRSAMRRFEYESQILGRLRHPGIAQIYEAGTHDDPGAPGEPVPFFAMEYIPNARPITRYAIEEKLPTRQRLELFAQVCEAVHHGHQKGVIHRDLKPSNILVDPDGHVKIIDFGVARGTDSDMAITTIQTNVAHLIGTLQYMSPEQCAADPHDIDTRSDVYALGVVLYELLSDQLPYDVSNTPVFESTRVIHEQQPTRLSAANATLKGDAETIVLKALEKDRERRYQSAAELVRDIRRFLAGETIAARPPSIVYQLRVFARRNRLAFAAIAAVFVVLVAGVIVSTLARIAAGRAEQDALFQAYVANLHAASVALMVDDSATALQRLAAAPEALRNWEWHHLHREADHSLLTLRGHAGTVRSIAFSPDGTRLASGSSDGTAKLWDTASGQEVATLRGHMTRVRYLAFSPDGTSIALVSLDKTVRLWNPTTLQERVPLRGHTDNVLSLAFSPDGTRIVTASTDNTIKLWELATSRVLATMRGHIRPPTCVAYSSDGTRIASGSFDDTVKIWDAEPQPAGATLWGQEGLLVYSVAFSPDGTQIVTGSRDKTVKLWDVTSGLQLAALRGHTAVINSVAFSPDGTRIASRSVDGTVKLWDAVTGDELTTLREHNRSGRWLLFSVTFSPDGARVASGLDDGTIKLWDASTGQELAVLRGYANCVAFSPDGTRIASGSYDRTIKLWDTASGQEVATLRGHTNSVHAVAFSPDGMRIASGGSADGLRLWDATTGRELGFPREYRGPVSSIAFNPDGTRIAAACRDKTVRLWEASTGRELIPLRGHTDWVHTVAFSPDGTRLVSGSWNNTILWDRAPRAVREAEVRAATVARAKAEPIVDRLMETLDDPAKIAAHLRADTSLSTPVRQAALNLLLSHYAAAERVIERLSRDAAALGRFARALALPDAESRFHDLALRAVQMAISAQPDEPTHLRTKFRILALCKKDISAANIVGRYLIEKAAEDAKLLNNFAWDLLTKEEFGHQFNELALAAAEKSHLASGGEDWRYLDTYALAKFETGDVDGAIELETKAIELCPADRAADVKEVLQRFEAAKKQD